MNLQVDLLLDSERRSGSAVRRKFLVRLALVIVPLVVLGLLGALFAAERSACHELRYAEQEKARIDPEHKKVARMEIEYNKLNALRATLQDWSQTRLDIYGLLRGLQNATPLSIQLTRLVLNEKLEADGRTVAFSLNGKVVGQYPEADVQCLFQALKSDRPFSNVMDLAEVKRFAASEILEEQDARVFEIECWLKARLLGTSSVSALRKR